MLTEGRQGGGTKKWKPKKRRNGETPWGHMGWLENVGQLGEFPDFPAFFLYVKNPFCRILLPTFGRIRMSNLKQLRNCSDSAWPAPGQWFFPMASESTRSTKTESTIKSPRFENISLDTVLATESELCCLKDSQSKACESILTRSRNRLLACFLYTWSLYWVQGAKVG